MCVVGREPCMNVHAMKESGAHGFGRIDPPLLTVLFLAVLLFSTHIVSHTHTPKTPIVDLNQLVRCLTHS